MLTRNLVFDYYMFVMKTAPCIFYNSFKTPYLKTGAVVRCNSDAKKPAISYRYSVSSLNFGKIHSEINKSELIGSRIYHSVSKSLDEKLENPRICSERLKNIKCILDENKEELEEILKSSYFELKKAYDFEPSESKEEGYSAWRPSMNLSDAENYTKGSKYARYRFYRASASPERAKRLGYQYSHTKETHPGVYVSDDKGSAEIYASKSLPLKININNVVHLDDAYGFERHLFNAINKRTGNKELFDALWDIRGIVENSFAKALNIDAFERRVQAFPEDYPSCGLAIVNPKDIVVIDD